MRTMNDEEYKKHQQEEARKDREFKSKREQEMLKKYPLTPATEGMIEDEVRAAQNLGPRPRPASEGIKDMRARIRELKRDKSKTIDTLDEVTGVQRKALLKDLDKLNAEIADAEKRVKEYKTQKKGLN